MLAECELPRRVRSPAIWLYDTECARSPYATHSILGDTSFGPDQIAVLVSAYEAAMRELDIAGPYGSGR